MLPKTAAAMAPLHGVVAFLQCRADGGYDPNVSIRSMLQAMGAQVAQRVNKDVTHIVFRRKATPTSQVNCFLSDPTSS